jgi:hypothetical protein
MTNELITTNVSSGNKVLTFGDQTLVSFSRTSSMWFGNFFPKTQPSSFDEFEAYPSNVHISIERFRDGN